LRIERDQPGNAGFRHYWRGEQKGLDPTGRQRLRLPQFRAAHAQRAGRDLRLRNLHRFVGLGVGTQCDAMRLGMRCHPGDVPRKNIEINRQRRGLQPRRSPRHADQARIEEIHHRLVSD
jgi:hypothetical protein